MNRRLREIGLTLPSFLWLFFLFLIPTMLVLAMAFKPSDGYGGIGPGWTLGTIKGLGNPSYPAIILRTVSLSVMTTLICVALSIPMGYYMARTKHAWRRTLVLLTVVPFWICFLVRVFAWKHLLHPDGFIRGLLLALGLIDSDTMLLYSSATVLLVMVYSHLPFAILPVFAAAEKFDFQLFEAAMDLGATRWYAFARVFLPGIGRGIGTAVLVVLIPALGSYVIPDMVGGTDSEMIGNKIAQRTFGDRNLPHACALAALLTIAVLGPLLGVVFRKDRSGAPRHVKGVGA
jgi:spermidine/putrescine transport system permease protein